MVVHAAHVPSCSNVRPHLSKLGPTEQDERVAKSTAAKKQPRTQKAVETLNKWGFNTKFNLGAVGNCNVYGRTLLESCSTSEVCESLWSRAALSRFVRVYGVVWHFRGL
jgi:hypothetical protein